MNGFDGVDKAKIQHDGAGGGQCVGFGVWDEVGVYEILDCADEGKDDYWNIFGGGRRESVGGGE